MPQHALTVHRLASVADGTWLELEVLDAGVQPWPAPPPQPTHFDGAIILRDPGGGIRGEAAFGGQRIHKHAGGATAWTRLHLPGVRLGAGEALVVANLTTQALSVAARVRLLPAAEVGLPASRPQGAEATVRGITVSVLSAALGGDPAVVRMDASGVGGYAMIGSRMGTRGRGGELVLRDADGREYLEEISLHPTSHGSALFDDVAHFPKLPPDARGLELIVPTVSVHEREGEAVVDVPMDGLRPNVRRQLSRDLRLGGYPLRVTGVELVPADQGTVELHGRPSLALHLDLGDAIDGRLLLYPSLVMVDGQQLGWNIRWRPGNVMRSDLVEVPLPPGHGDIVRVTLRMPTVEIEGPWVVPLDLERSG